jgi:hypothetical protein
VNVLLLAAGIASMTAALERGDLDEAARQGALAGPAVVEQALHSKVRTTQLAAILAAPTTEDRVELLAPLSDVAAGPDRRTAIPAARAAFTIAVELSQRDLPDDIAAADVAGWRARFESIAKDADHFIEVRVLALETADALGGYDHAAFAADTDPLMRAEAK